MLPQEIILKKRRGETLTGAEISGFIGGLTRGEVTDAQAAALAMAICFQGMEDDERVALTLAMRDSGTVMRWDMPGPVVDKHSTGGVGDNVSLMLAPALAACGAFVPMISGRGLGHTGGTLDKLSAIPGYDPAPGPERLREVVREVGCAIIGQTADLAPADKRLYAIRDVTGTVESVDLITASILSKKLAAGLDALILDVKSGSGAFMDNDADAARLARSLVAVANGAGCRTAALITDMDQPLAPAAGNAVETALAARFLAGWEVDARLWDVTVALGGDLLALCGIARDASDGRGRIAGALESGRAAEVFGRMVTTLGGPADFMERFEEILPRAPIIRDLPSSVAGVVQRIDGRAVGNAVVDLGGGRTRPQDDVNPAVGLTDIAAIGAALDIGDPIARIHAGDQASWDRAAARITAAYAIGDGAPEHLDPIRARIGPDDI
ncbi:MAG: thymidine phosphorylase [Paracoccaceae bacterium]|jgi:thymidine phosphorylase